MAWHSSISFYGLIEVSVTASDAAVEMITVKFSFGQGAAGGFRRGVAELERPATAFAKVAAN
jgi:hypothetical protein